MTNICINNKRARVNTHRKNGGTSNNPMIMTMRKMLYRCIAQWYVTYKLSVKHLLTNTTKIENILIIEISYIYLSAIAV